MSSHFVLKMKRHRHFVIICQMSQYLENRNATLRSFTIEISKLVIVCCTFYPIYATLGASYSKQNSFISLKEGKNYHDRQ